MVSYLIQNARGHSSARTCGVKRAWFHILFVTTANKFRWTLPPCNKIRGLKRPIAKSSKWSRSRVHRSAMTYIHYFYCVYCNGTEVKIKLQRIYVAERPLEVIGTLNINDLLHLFRFFLGTLIKNWKWCGDTRLLTTKEWRTQFDGKKVACSTRTRTQIFIFLLKREKLHSRFMTQHGPQLQLPKSPCIHSQQSDLWKGIKSPRVPETSGSILWSGTCAKDLKPCCHYFPRNNC